MRIQKYLHSCLLISEGDQKILIDPGSFCFIEGKVKPEDIGPVDVILLTHEHPDHYYPEALKVIAAKSGFTASRQTATQKPAIITHASLQKLLQNDGMNARVIEAGETVEQGAFRIQAIEAPHGDLPMPKPENLGYVINKTLFHPGDSLEFTLSETPQVLALPVTAPWLTLKQALDMVVRVKPETVIPIHDAILKDFMLERIYAMCEKILGERGIAFRPLKLGEIFEV